MSIFDKIKIKFTNTKEQEEVDKQVKVQEEILENITTIPKQSDSVDAIVQAESSPVSNEIIELNNEIEGKIEEESNMCSIDVAEDISQEITPLQTEIDEVKNEIEEKVEETDEDKKTFFSKTSSFFTNIAQKTSESLKSTFGAEKIKKGLTKTRKSFSNNLKKVLGVGRKIDDTLLAEIEELLITADIGVETTEQIINSLRQRVKSENWENSEDLFVLLREEISKIITDSPSANNDKLYDIEQNSRPLVILIIGVNGVGKTTTIGKLAFNYKAAGKDVIIGAADTFRAAANEQLEIWAKRAGVDIVQQQLGADPAAVAFDTLKSAQSKNKDVVLIDTAGRLHNKIHLMNELEKIARVMKKLKTSAPDEVFLVLDATTGQNAIFQAKEFAKVAKISGIILTKLDGTAKGGVVIPIANELKIPVRYIGVGEQIDDLQPFDAKAFIEGLFEEKENNEEYDINEH
jgi:fused signal recognition particle receptor